MHTPRQHKLETLFKKLTARFLSEETRTSDLVTVTHVSLSKDARNATVFLTVFPDTHEEKTIKSINALRGECARYIATRTKMKTTPRVAFALDKGEKNRQKIDELLKKSSS